MTLTSSRISDEFKLVQEILAKSPGFGKSFQLYPNLYIAVHASGYVTWFEEDKIEFDVVVGRDTARNFARHILRRYW